ncbi:MAG: Ig-like domain-containing protein [Dehalococcoidales bacterium]|nr:Ig-like domain-containing protein [Dehalococcoidales bacterium]
MFCRNCGKGLVVTPDKTCVSCGANTVKATSFCRYCGKPTSAHDLTCPTCGSAIKPIPGSVKALNKENPKLIKLGKIVNLTIVAILVTAYIVFSLPPKVTKPVKAAASDAMLATTGYTALPLNSISAMPTRIPRTNPEPTIRAFEDHAVYHNPDFVAVFAPNDTVQLTINALYRNTATINASGAGRIEDVTGNCTYKSSNEKIATVTSGGLVRAVVVGSTTITVSYTAAPGSANFTAASAGKEPITVATTVPVIVTKLPVSLGGKP